MFSRLNIVEEHFLRLSDISDNLFYCLGIVFHLSHLEFVLHRVQVIVFVFIVDFFGVLVGLFGYSKALVDEGLLGDDFWSVRIGKQGLFKDMKALFLYLIPAQIVCHNHIIRDTLMLGVS